VRVDSAGDKRRAVRNNRAIEAPPTWFSNAVATPSESHGITVEGCEVRYLRWGRTGRPGLVLVHGGAAHAHWWSFIAPLLASQYDVVAPDLSGHGDSGRRNAYPRETWARELMAVIDDAAFPGAPVVVGHSLGGFVTIVAAALYGPRLAGAIVVDSPVRRPDPESEEGARGRMFRNPKTYPSLEEAISHFHLVPPQPCTNSFIIEHIARHALRRVEDGWTWKFDPMVFVKVSLTPMSEFLTNVRCRIALLRGELSDLVPPEIGEYMYGLLDRDAPVIEIPQAHHHVPLDQPLTLVAVIRALLADWEHSLPRKLRA
jgi:pimeloyl-ACP methyl ester carboxylesterase